MKKFAGVYLVMFMLIPLERAFSLLGIGAYGISDPISVGGAVDAPYGTGDPLYFALERKGFEGALGVGAFVYLDAIPFIDLEANLEASGSQYQFQFANAALDTLGPVNFGWTRASGYVTVRKKIFGVGLPILGGVKIHVGGGLNLHQSTPLADLAMVENLLGGDLTADFEPQELEDKLVKYLEDNAIESSGYHVQVGAQLKLLAINAFLNYRLTFAKDVVPGADSFSSLWLALAFGL